MSFALMQYDALVWNAQVGTVVSELSTLLPELAKTTARSKYMVRAQRSMHAAAAESL